MKAELSVCDINVKIYAFWQKILYEEGCAGEGFAVGVISQFKRPASTRRTDCDGKIENMPAGLVLSGQLAAVFDTVRAQENGGQRQPLQRFCFAVA